MTGSPVALVLRALGLGDLLTAVPALRAVRRALPKHRVVLATDPALAPLALLSGAVDDVFPAKGLVPLPWTDPPPEVAVNLHGRGPESHRILMQTAPRRLVAYACTAAGIAGPRWDEREHEVRRWCRLVETGFGVPAPAADLELIVPQVRPPVHDAVVVHPGAAYPSRRWPANRFAKVAFYCRARHGQVVVTGSARERGLAESVCRAAGLPEEACLAGRTSLLELAALVAHARLAVSGDTGVAHLATAYRTPSVVLFGPTSPSLWGPIGPGPHIALWHGDAASLQPGDPWGARLDPTLVGITVEEVISATQRLLAERLPARGTTARLPLDRRPTTTPVPSPEVAGPA